MQHTKNCILNVIVAVALESPRVRPVLALTYLVQAEGIGYSDHLEGGDFSHVFPTAVRGYGFRRCAGMGAVDSWTRQDAAAGRKATIWRNNSETQHFFPESAKQQQRTFFPRNSCAYFSARRAAATGVVSASVCLCLCGIDEAVVYDVRPTVKTACVKLCFYCWWSIPNLNQ